jgi:hypothetical protein
VVHVSLEGPEYFSIRKHQRHQTISFTERLPESRRRDLIIHSLNLSAQPAGRDVP